MLKLATVLMTTSVFAGLLISGPTGLVMTASALTSQTTAVKVKTIAIHLQPSPTRTAKPAAVGGLLDPNPLYVPAVLARTNGDSNRA